MRWSLGEGLQPAGWIIKRKDSPERGMRRAAFEVGLLEGGSMTGTRFLL